MTANINPAAIDHQMMYFNSLSSMRAPQGSQRSSSSEEKKYSYEDLFGIVKSATVVYPDGRNVPLKDILKV